MNRKTNLKMRVLILVVVVAVTGAMWNVTTVYGQAQPDYPFDGAVITGDETTYLGEDYIWTKLYFFPGATAVSHTGYFHEDYSKVDSRDPCAFLGAPPYAHVQGWEYTFFAGNPQVDPATDSLVRGTKYYWTVDETDALGNTVAGDVWEFTIQGFKASSPNPPNEAIFVETEVLLSWLPGFFVDEHDVYLGTDLESVELAEFDVTVPPPEFVGTTSEASILVTGLTQGVKYYWRVDEVSGRSPFTRGTYYKGDVWCFTTIPEGLGSIREDLWWGIAGKEIEDLLNDPRYPGNPDEIRMLTSFDSGIALGDEYGGQIHGWLHPAKSGDYTFWLCSDDSSELFLSTDHTPANKVRIANIDGWAEWPYDWYNQGGTDNPNQESAPISLVGGEKYYIMAHWKEDFGDDFCMVAWQGPDQPLAPVNGSASAVIPGNRLSPFVQLWAHNPDPCDGQVSVESPVTLRWGPGDNAAEHDVYVGTDQALVESRAPGVYAGRIDSNSYNLGHVFSGMIYYWAIDEVSDIGLEPDIWEGDVWSFTTLPAPIFVDVDATGSNNGSNWADAYNSLQDGLARANSSVKPVEIRVAQGIYKPTQPPPPPPPGAPPLPPPSFDRTATFQLINNVTVKGGYAGFGETDPNARDFKLYETILRGDLNSDDVDVNDPTDLLDEPSRSENSYHVVTGTGTDSTALLDGFTITGGNANIFPHDEGGGMYTKDGSPTIYNCTFSGNCARGVGGAMAYRNSNSELKNCTFINNSAGKGCGILCYESSLTLTNCTFIGNSSNWGWPPPPGPPLTILSDSSMFTDYALSNNIASAGLSGSGGGIYCSFSSATLTNCTFTGNLAHSGGGIDTFESALTLTNCTFSSNLAEYGGGIRQSYSNFAFTNCLFSGNSAEYGGGILTSESDLTLTNCTFSGNSAGCGGAICNYSGENVLILSNCILWNGGDEISNRNNDGFTIKVTYSNVWGAWPGEGNIDADPCFVEPGYWDSNGVWIEGDYHLLADSPCIDAGDPCYVAGPNETDLDGRPRVIGGRIDMGAYEFFNTRPIGDAGDDRVVECACNTAEGTMITLDGSGSYDVDGDALTYSWTGPFVESPADGATPTVTLEAGCPDDYVITLVVNDGTEDSEPDEVVLTVEDTTPPEFTFSVTPTKLWPPNKKMVKITPSWTLSDDCDATPDVSLVSVSVNESEARNNGKTDDDIQIGDDGTIYVRAKRNRTGDRIYTITYQAVDGSGNAAVRSATVTVPRKRR